MRMLMDEDHIVRTDAVSALSECPMSAQIAVTLTEMLRDSSESVRQAARKTLENRLEPEIAEPPAVSSNEQPANSN